MPLIVTGLFSGLSVIALMLHIYGTVWGKYCASAQPQNKHKYHNSKSVPTEYNEDVFHVVTIMIDLEGCVLLAAVILMLLLKSGDIETNPGPRDRIAQSSNQASPPGSEKSLEVPQSEDVQILSEDSMLRKTNAGSKSSLEVDRMLGDFGGFTIHPTDEDIKDDIDSEQIPDPSDSGTKRLMKQALPLWDDSTLANSDTSGQCHILQPTSGDNNSESMYYLPTFQSDPDEQLISHRSESVAKLEQYYTTTSISEKEVVQETIIEWREKSVGEKLNCCRTFDNVLINLFLNLGRLYRDGKTYDLCPVCLEKKGEARQSHIIPLCILKEFRYIHVPVCSFNGQP